MSLLLMVMGIACKRDAPRYEPDPIDDQEYMESPTIGLNCKKKPSKSIPNEVQPCDPLGDKLFHFCQRFENVKKLITDIGWNKYVTCSVRPQDDFTASIAAKLETVNHVRKGQPNRLPNRLFIFVVENQEDGSRDGCIGAESITIKSNRELPDTFDLKAFLIHIPANDVVPERLVALVKSEQNWYYYNNNGTRTALSTTGAMHIASQHGTIFLYEKIT
ncbi:hypothetical protein [Cardinium endosymbiont of Oedothorax gibbosus]|uniref:hypothetical protein n=1 Tax=Cardinium endosymbiont of Oedothorax gibbosus TaxID=931101 RepID=UPI0020241D45|nr:hypothetical protein [Cardinium endosymbiont of Oedothorax gibbosus]